MTTMTIGESTVPSPFSSGAKLLLPLFLAVVLVIAYWPVLNSDFINYDDPTYVTANDRVKQGLKPDALIAAFKTTTGGLWQPIATLSHMTDVSLYGMNPKWHHFSSLLFHILNALLLFALLARLTGSGWRSALAASLSCPPWAGRRR